MPTDTPFCENTKSSRPSTSWPSASCRIIRGIPRLSNDSMHRASSTTGATISPRRRGPSRKSTEKRTDTSQRFARISSARNRREGSRPRPETRNTGASMAWEERPLRHPVHVVGRPGAGGRHFYFFYNSFFILFSLSQKFWGFRHPRRGNRHRTMVLR